VLFNVEFRSRRRFLRTVGARSDDRVEIIHLYIVSIAVKREVEIYVRLRSVDFIYSCVLFPAVTCRPLVEVT